MSASGIFPENVGRISPAIIPAIAVNACPKKIELIFSDGSARFTAIYINAMKNPAKTAIIFPNRPPPSICSKKKKDMPIKVSATAKISIIFAFSCKNTMLIISIKIGAVNCKTIAFAAVVSLFAATNALKVSIINIAEISTFLVGFSFS